MKKTKSTTEIEETLDRLRVCLTNHELSNQSWVDGRCITFHQAKKQILALLTQQDKAVDRFEVIDDTGRAYVKGSIYGSPVRIEQSYQDGGKTLKVFVEDLSDKEEV